MPKSLTPISTFYQSKNYIPLINRSVIRIFDSIRLEVRCKEPAIKGWLKSYFEETGFDRAGILKGEYGLIGDGLLLINNKFQVLKCNVAWEDAPVSTFYDGECASDSFMKVAQHFAEQWNDIRVIDNPIVLTDAYARNYFHFSLEMLPRLRFFSSSPHSPVVISQHAIEKNYQKSLIQHALGARIIYPIHNAIKVRNPMLSHGLLSAEAVQWLRDSIGLSIWPGRKRIYIRRSGQGTRIGGGGGISESGDFRALLESFDFEIVEFGNGDLSVEDQLSKLKDVGLIVAAHGAALANIAYLNPPLTIIEIAGINAARPTYLHLSSFLGFRHKMIVSDFYDREGNIVVDVVELANAIEDAMQMMS